MNLLVVDNYDSFTYMLVDYLQQAGATCRVIRNDESWPEITENPVDAVVLSPGPGTPRQAGKLMAIIQHYYRRLPILGVCLGHQALGEFFGAHLTNASQPMHGKVSRIKTVAEDALWSGLPGEFEVTRYHSLVLTKMPESLETTAVTAQQEVMAFRHRELPVWGVQFHPEAALTAYGFQLIENWIEFVMFTYKNTVPILSLTRQRQYA